MTRIFRTALISFGFVMLAASLPAQAQGMSKQAWNFNNTTSRASIAALLMQKEQLDRQSAGTAVVGGVGDTNVCGGGGSEATATSNYTCIIIGDGAQAAIQAVQESTGNQQATTTTETTVAGDESLSKIIEGMNVQ